MKQHPVWPLLTVLIGLTLAIGIPPQASLKHIAIQGVVAIAVMAAGAYWINKQEIDQ